MQKTDWERIEEIVKEACLESGVSLYDLENRNTNKGNVIFVQITRIGGVTVGECAKVNRYIGHRLDEMDVFEGRYFIEVSSPGIERPLKFKKHYMSAISERIQIQYTTEAGKESFEGVLEEVNPDSIIVTNGEDRREIAFPSIRKTKTVFDLSALKEKK